MQILTDIDLKPYNTFQVSCIADYFVVIKSREEYIELMQTDIYQSAIQTTKILTLGGGSNILLTTPTYHGLVIKNEITGIYVAKTLVPEAEVNIRVGAGEVWNDFVWWTIDNNYVGLENLVHIPGSVGAAPMQNIGAYGVEVGHTIERVEGINTHTGEEIKLDTQACQFGYRDSVFKQALAGQVYITHVTFRLPLYDESTYTPHTNYGAIQNELSHIPDAERTPRHIANAIVKIRDRKLPDWKKIGTAGSFFKNPIVETPAYSELLKQFPQLVGRPITPPDQYDKTKKNALNTHTKLSAGQLIDMCGLKGLTRGDSSVGTYKHHALVLVNHGGGTGQQLTDLAIHIQDTVYEKTGVMLDPEVNYI